MGTIGGLVILSTCSLVSIWFRFPVGSLAESLTEVSGRSAATTDTRFPIVDCLLPYRLPPTVVVGIGRAAGEKPWGFW